MVPQMEMPMPVGQKQQMHPLPNIFGTPINNQMLSPQGQFNRQNRPNAKHWANMNYCWTHRFDIHGNHMSQTCQHQAMGHMPFATCQNTTHGSTTNQHKIWMGPMNM
eukprot:9315164-Ditylum_brightwellii.AAC.1